MTNFPDLSKVTQARYIKLGPGGQWDELCIVEGTIRLGYYDVPHELALAGKLETIQRIYVKQGKAKGASTNHARQVLDFYSCGEDTVWVTFSKGFLWWGVAEPEVTLIDYDRKGHDERGNRFRRMIGGWHKTDIHGRELHRVDLAGFLTMKSGFQGTICNIRLSEFAYLMRMINAEELPEAIAARQAKATMEQAVTGLINHLEPGDFELLVDLIFSRGGWQRVGAVGGTQKTTDLELIQPLTGERAAVQVKSSTNQTQLQEYIDSFAGMGADRYFYVYHSTRQKLDVGDSSIRLVGPVELAHYAVDLGLTDWLLRKAC